jgi:hypothetical protein
LHLFEVSALEAAEAGSLCRTAPAANNPNANIPKFHFATLQSLHLCGSIIKQSADGHEPGAIYKNAVPK